MKKIYYIDRDTKEKKKELIYGEKGLLFLYGERKYFKFISSIFLTILCRFSFFSRFYGWLQKKSFTRKKVKPFIKKFNINQSEFEKTSFSSFNDFFIRKLLPSARPIDQAKNKVIIPADGRYLAYESFREIKKLFVKGVKFSLEKFLNDNELALKYQDAPIVIARLCPVDYHRFHFPVDCIPSKSLLINGNLNSVNPIALWNNLCNLNTNKRVITKLLNPKLGEILFVEIGAINVGSIHQTYQPNQTYLKGQEKGYFSFGGSCIVLLFEKNTINLDQDLISASSDKIETYAKMGQSLATFKF